MKILYPKLMIVLWVVVFLIDLESNLQNMIVRLRMDNVMDLHKVMYKVMKVKLTRGNVTDPGKKETMTYLLNSMTYLPNNSQRRHIRQGKLHVACIPIKPIKNQSLVSSSEWA